MYSVRYGGKAGRVLRLAESNHHIAVRTANKAPLRRATISEQGWRSLEPFRPVTRFARAGVEVLATDIGRGARSARDAARRALKKERTIRFAGRALVDRVSGEPVLYTENFFVKFHDDVPLRECRRLLKAHKLSVKRPLGFAHNAFFVNAADGTGLKVFEMSEGLLEHPAVELCHPELVRQIRRRAAFPGQWHLKKMRVNGNLVDAHANVEAAWAFTRGEGVTVALIDDGFDIDHEEFRSAGKTVSPRNASFDNANPRPGSEDDHGTSCAGVAVADGRFGASGVAPAARFMPIRCVSDLGSVEEAEAFQWAVEHGADVISCSWGPEDGDPENPHDPLHRRRAPLPDSTREAIKYAVTHGRNGYGCVVCYAAGNGNESVDNDGYASHERVIAVAACTDSSRRAFYSDYGKAVWCCFPSDGGRLTPGIFTIDRSGPDGYNVGRPTLGDPEGDYTNDFGGTSSACPGVAGVAALVLSRNPNLRWDEVREILRQSCDPIDRRGGQYSRQGHSPKYGYGRVNALRAVELATSTLQPSVVAAVAGEREIRGPRPAKLSLSVAEARPLTSLRVTVDIEHPNVAELLVTLVAPQAMREPTIVLHERGAVPSRDLKRTYEPIGTPELGRLLGRAPTGEWTLRVEPRKRGRAGVLRKLTLEMGF